MKQILLYSILLLSLLGCSDNKSRISKMVEDTIGKEIKLSNYHFVIQSDTISTDWIESPFRIITFLDSAECTECNMHLASWTELMNRINNTEDVSVSLLMVLKHSSSDKIIKILERRDFRHMVAVIGSDSLMSEDYFPRDRAMRTFLLNSSNEIIAIGNPVLNPKIEDLYRALISEGNDDDVSEIKIQNRSFGVARRGESVKIHFEVKNPSSDTLTIQRIIQSCDCVSANLGNEILPPGVTAEIVVAYTPRDEYGYVERHVDVFFNELEIPERLKLYGYVK